MKKVLYIVLLAVVGLTMYSCDDYETYAEQRDYEISRISSFINNPTQGEIKGKKINVISEEEFLKDTITNLSKNEFVLLGNGVYMQIVRRGCGSILKNGECTTVLCRFKEYNINADSLQLRNDAALTQQDYYEKFDVYNTSGTFSASFKKSEENTGYHGVMYYRYSTASVPSGWLAPLSYIKLGRPANDGDEVAKVRLIVPHDQGHSNANSGVYACYYEITYERGI